MKDRNWHVLRRALPAIVLLTSFGLVLAPRAAEASTSTQQVHHAGGELAGEAWFNSGNSLRSHDNAHEGFDVFTVTDKFCGDGWSVGVEWELDGQRHERRLLGDCSPTEQNFETGQASSTLKEFQWRVFMWDTNAITPNQYPADHMTDWMGSRGSCDSWLINESSIYRDHSVRNGVDGDSFTISLTPSDLARWVGSGATDGLWEKIDECTPLPDFLSQDERESLKKQLKCHLVFAKTEDLGGPTWDLESYRPNIPDWEVYRIAHECNW